MAFSINGDGGETGPKWEITEPALYTITFDKSTKTIVCERSGDFMPEGTNDFFTHMWLIICRPEAPYPFEMERDGGNWKITRNLQNTEYIKFYGESIPRNEWDTPYSLKWFCSLVDGELILDSGSDSGTRYFKYGADNTFSWRVPSVGVGPGNYTITLSPGEGTVSFVRNN